MNTQETRYLLTADLLDAWARHAHAANGFGDAAVPLTVGPTPMRNCSHDTESGRGPATLPRLCALSAPSPQRADAWTRMPVARS